MYGRQLGAGRLHVGVGYDYRNDMDTSVSESGARVFAEWRSGAWF